MRWQFAQRISHLAISTSILDQEIALPIVLLYREFCFRVYDQIQAHVCHLHHNQHRDVQINICIAFVYFRRSPDDYE